MLLQLAAYVALLIASKMSEISPLRMKSLANLTGRMFTPLQVRAAQASFLCFFRNLSGVAELHPPKLEYPR